MNTRPTDAQLDEAQAALQRHAERILAQLDVQPTPGRIRILTNLLTNTYARGWKAGKRRAEPTT